MNLAQALDDIKAFIASDPLVQEALSLGEIPGQTRQVLADVLHTTAAEVKRAMQDAADQARADAAAAATAASVAAVPDEAYPQ